MKWNTDDPPMEYLPPNASASFGIPREVVNWDTLKFYLALCETGSFQGAAKLLNVSVNLVRRKIDALENDLSVVLVTRSTRGIQITEDGKSVLTVAMAMREQVGYLDTMAVRKASAMEGIIRLAVTDGIGTFWVAPRLSAFLADHPKLRVDLHSEMRVADLSKLECDIAVQLQEPTDPDLKTRQIGTLHLIPYASAAYIGRRGTPQTYEDLVDHTLVNLIAEQIPSHILAERTKNDPNLKFARLITHTSSAQVTAIAASAGIGLLPTYTSAITRNILPIESDIYFKRPIWLAHHPDANRVARTQWMIDWLVSIFDPAKNPWFRETFVSPTAFLVEADHPAAQLSLALR